MDTHPWPWRSRKNTWPSGHTVPPPGRKWQRTPWKREHGLMQDTEPVSQAHLAVLPLQACFDWSLLLLMHSVPRHSTANCWELWAIKGSPTKVWSRSECSFKCLVYSQELGLISPFSLHSASLGFFSNPLKHKLACVTHLSLTFLLLDKLHLALILYARTFWI